MCDDAEMDRRAVIVADMQGVIRFWSDGAAALFGYSAEQAVGASLDLVVPDHLRDAHWAGFHRAMNSPALKDLAADLPVKCSDGQVRPFAGRLIVLMDGLGNAVGATAVYTPDGSTGVTPFS